MFAFDITFQKRIVTVEARNLLKVNNSAGEL